MKKFLLFLIPLLFITGCEKDVVKKTDAIRFKEEFESKNEDYLFVEIDENNPFIYSSIDDIKSILESSGVILFGSSTDNNTRYIINDLILSAKSTYYKKIYYYDILNDIEKVYDLIPNLTIPSVMFVHEKEIYVYIINQDDTNLKLLFEEKIHFVLNDLCNSEC